MPSLFSSRWAKYLLFKCVQLGILQEQHNQQPKPQTHLKHEGECRLEQTFRGTSIPLPKVFTFSLFFCYSLWVSSLLEEYMCASRTKFLSK